MFKNVQKRLTGFGVCVKRIESRFKRRDSEVEALEILAHPFFQRTVSLRHEVLLDEGLGEFPQKNSYISLNASRDVEPRGQRRGTWLTPERGTYPSADPVGQKLAHSSSLSSERGRLYPACSGREIQRFFYFRR